MLTDEQIKARGRELSEEYLAEVRTSGEDGADDGGIDTSWIRAEHLPAMTGIAIARSLKLEARVEELEREVEELRASTP